MAHEACLKSIKTGVLVTPNDENDRHCIMKAVVEVEVEKGRFEGIGDADPSSVEAFLAPRLIRVAETRAKARALRDAVNCGVVSFEELDDVSLDRDSSPGPGASPAPRRGQNGPSGRPTRPSGPRNGSERVGSQARTAPRSGNGSPEPMTEA